MSNSISIWLVLLLAVFAANVPFFSQRLFGVISWSRPKSLAVRLGELVLLYFVAGGAGLLMEKRIGQIAPQGWEFYAITATFFLTLAFPGFVYRHLLKHRD